MCEWVAWLLRNVLHALDWDMGAQHLEGWGGEPPRQAPVDLDVPGRCWQMASVNVTLSLQPNVLACVEKCRLLMLVWCFILFK